MTVEHKDLVRVIVKGGILSPGDMMGIVSVAKKLGSDAVHLGSRQDVLFAVNSQQHIDQLAQLPLPYEYQNERHENIVSSYVTFDLMPSTRWLAPHLYHYVLDSFNYHPTYKINITDPLQGMVPLFTGYINFVASPVDNYWYLYLRYPGQDRPMWCCPDLIYGFDLTKVAKELEAADPIGRGTDPHEAYRQLKESVPFTTQASEETLRYPEMVFPYYEGWHHIDGDRYWMGVYWRNNRFTSKFLQALCQLCLDTNLGTISLTPWKSIIIKDIRQQDLLAWEKLLGKYGINMRHSSLELNWHIPVAHQAALDLKNDLVRVLDQQDISTYGLTFAIKTRKHQEPFASVIIEVVPSADATPELYHIAYAREFNPNLLDYIYYAKGVIREVIPPLLIELSKKYYEQLTADKFAPSPEEGPHTERQQRTVYQCSECQSVYDPVVGEPSAGVSAGTAFESLPDSHVCQVCGGPKELFVASSWSEP